MCTVHLQYSQNMQVKHSKQKQDTGRQMDKEKIVMEKKMDQ